MTYQKLPYAGSCVPADGRLAVGRTLRCRQGLTYLCLGQAQGQPPDLEILGKLSDFLQIDALLAAHYLLGLYDRRKNPVKNNYPVQSRALCLDGRSRCIRTAHELAHFRHVSTGDGPGGGERGGRLQDGRLRRDDDRRLGGGGNQSLGGSEQTIDV